MKKLFMSLLYLVITIFLMPSSGIYAAEKIQEAVYYVRFDVKSVDNRMVRSNLLIVPAENEFRQEQFSAFIISGGADYNAKGEKGISIQNRAAHNAIRNFLEVNGLESVKSQSTTVRGLADDNRTMVNDQTVVSFEGAVKLPYQILNSDFNNDTGIYSVTIRLKFAPLAFPDKWEDMFFKHKIKMLFNEFKSFF